MYNLKHMYNLNIHVFIYIFFRMSNLTNQLKFKINNKHMFDLISIEPCVISKTYLEINQDLKNFLDDIFCKNLIKFEDIKKIIIINTFYKNNTNYIITFKYCNEQKQKFEISEDNYYDLSVKKSILEIRKNRYSIPIDKTELMIKFDMFTDNNLGLNIAKIKFCNKYSKDQVDTLVKQILGSNIENICVTNKYNFL